MDGQTAAKQSEYLRNFAHNGQVRTCPIDGEQGAGSRLLDGKTLLSSDEMLEHSAVKLRTARSALADQSHVFLVGLSLDCSGTGCWNRVAWVVEADKGGFAPHP
jgi:hypothetical protein